MDETTSGHGRVLVHPNNKKTLRILAVMWKYIYADRGMLFDKCLGMSFMYTISTGKSSNYLS